MTTTTEMVGVVGKFHWKCKDGRKCYVKHGLQPLGIMRGVIPGGKNLWPRPSISAMDVDALVEIGGHILLAEYKHPPMRDLSEGQEASLVRTARTLYAGGATKTILQIIYTDLAGDEQRFPVDSVLDIRHYSPKTDTWTNTRTTLGRLLNYWHQWGHEADNDPTPIKAAEGQNGRRLQTPPAPVLHAAPWQCPACGATMNAGYANQRRHLEQCPQASDLRAILFGGNQQSLLG